MAEPRRLLEPGGFGVDASHVPQDVGHTLVGVHVNDGRLAMIVECGDGRDGDLPGEEAHVEGKLRG